MKKRDGLGGLYRRTSRHTGEELPVWWMRYSIDGRQVRASTKSTDREAALDVLREKLGKIAAKKEMGIDRARLTVADAIAQLISRYEKKERASLKSGARATAKLWTDTIGSVRCVNVTNVVLEKIISTWKVSGGTVNRRLALLRHALRLSHIIIDPTKLNFSELWETESDPRDVYMPPEDFAAICEHLPPDLQAFCTFCYLTGTRRGQATATKWEFVDVDRWVISWSSASTKSRRVHPLGLAGTSLEIVQKLWQQRKPGAEYVFDVTNLRKAWDAAVKAAGLEGKYRFHDMRRAAVTHVVGTGAASSVAMAISGHKTRAMLDRYSIPVLAEQRAALERASDHVAAKLAERKVIMIPPPIVQARVVDSRRRKSSRP